MQVLSVISHLLDYPKQEMIPARDELIEVVQQSPLNKQHQAAVIGFIEQRFAGDLMDWQAEYDGLFERGRALGLWLFEHIHGESRDRGQAMVDLVGQYKQAGLELDKKELPDYIPLFLEFLSSQGDDNARAGLQEVEHIIALLFCRLEKRQSDYAVLLDALLHVAQNQVDLTPIRAQLVTEKRDDTKQAIDKEWEEEVR